MTFLRNDNDTNNEHSGPCFVKYDYYKVSTKQNIYTSLILQKVT